MKRNTNAPERSTGRLTGDPACRSIIHGIALQGQATGFGLSSKGMPKTTFQDLLSHHRLAAQNVWPEPGSSARRRTVLRPAMARGVGAMVVARLLIIPFSLRHRGSSTFAFNRDQVSTVQSAKCKCTKVSPTLPLLRQRLRAPPSALAHACT